MGQPKSEVQRFRFGGFELNPRTGELASEGRKALLQEQPLQLLLALLERPGDLVTREELTAKLWPSGTFVDFERGLNKAVNKLREVLKDSADSPQFIETLPRKGYRFIASVTKDESAEESVAEVAPVAASRPWPWKYVAVIAAILVIGVAIAATNFMGWRSAIAARLQPSPLQMTSLAVLPLENLSGDPEQAYFADGMTDALITEVAKIGSARVISRTTVLRYKGTKKNIQQIGRELNIDGVVEGTILHSGDLVRITAQLIQVSTDNHLWAESYEGNVKDVLRLQQAVATDIARRIGSVVRPVEPIRTVNPEAYGEYLKGRYYFFQYTSEGWQKAIEHYTRAIEYDSQFAPAYAGLAESQVVAWAWDSLSTSDGLRQAQEAAQKALSLDPLLASAHLAMAEIYHQKLDAVNAEKEFRRALDLNPNDPLAWQLHGVHRLLLGESEKGIAEQERARSLDPFSPIINANLSRAFYFSRQYDKAIAQAQETLKIQPGYRVALGWLENAYRHKGLVEEAMSARLAAAKPEDAAAIERTYKISGYRGVLRSQAEADEKSGNLGRAARGFAQAGDKEQALAVLEDCYRLRRPGLTRLKMDPDLDPIRSDPRFIDLVRRVAFSE